MIKNLMNYFSFCHRQRSNPQGVCTSVQLSSVPASRRGECQLHRLHCGQLGQDHQRCESSLVFFVEGLSDTSI